MKLLGRRAFTLVELLVVIGIIGMLMALLLSAVVSTQEHARRLTCNKQMKDMAEATLNFVLQKNRFPGYADTWTVSDGAGGSQDYEVGWLPQLFANLDMDERLRDLTLWTNIDGDAAGLPDFLDYIPLMVCPSDRPDLDAALWTTDCGAGGPSPAPGIAHPTSYAVNGGKPDNGAADDKRDALFHDHRDSGVTKVVVGLEDIRDGKQHTLLLVENVDLVSWDSVVPFADDSATDGRTEPHQTVLFQDNTTPPTPPTAVTTENFNESLILPYDCSGSTSTQNSMADNLDYPHARPSSYHKEGFNIAYADGRVEPFFVDQSLMGDLTDPKHPYRQYRRMMTPNRGD